MKGSCPGGSYELADLDAVFDGSREPCVKFPGMGVGGECGIRRKSVSCPEMAYWSLFL